MSEANLVLDWALAKKHFDEVFGRYKELMGVRHVSVGPAIRLVFEPLQKRYDSGERTPELYAEMMKVE